MIVIQHHPLCLARADSVLGWVDRVDFGSNQFCNCHVYELKDKLREQLKGHDDGLSHLRT